MSGTFFAVVGPSGAGKDSLIGYARQALCDDGTFAFPARCITRGAGAGGEGHIAVTPQAFAEMKAAGAFVLDWGAHGLSYGIPGDVAGMTAAGRHVVVNLSRSVVNEAREHFANVHVVHVTAPAEIIASRLAARGREPAHDVRTRLGRADHTIPAGMDVSTICNAGRLADAGQALLDILTEKSG